MNVRKATGKNSDQEACLAQQLKHHTLLCESAELFGPVSIYAGCGTGRLCNYRRAAPNQKLPTSQTIMHR
eukprot:gene6381-13723_t